jgi:CBS domain-containing protein
MKCADLMNLDLRVLPSTATVRQAAFLMRDSSLGFLPVCDEEGRPLGVLTDRDIAVRAAAMDRLSGTIPVLEVMTGPPIVCWEHEELAVAERRMIERGVSRLVVVDAGGVVVGILSLTDLLRREPQRRALAVARGVLAREAQGPHFPIERIRLTPGELPAVGLDAHDVRRGSGLEGVIAGGSATRSMKEFPR